jgi:Curli production assembly/transport component CsgG/Short C-terminal domain
MNRKRFLVLCFTLAVLTSTADGQLKWGADRVVPLAIPRAPAFELSVKRIAFGKPNGPCSNELIDRMILPDFHENHLDVIERQQLDQILTEHDFSQTADADPATSVKLGKILGPSALILVSVYTCAPQQKSSSKDMVSFSGGGTYKSYTYETRFTLEGSIKVVDLTTGKLLGSHEFQSKPEKSNPDKDSTPDYPPVDVVKDLAMQEVRAEVHRMFFPSREFKNVVFYDDKDCGLKEAYELTQRGDPAGGLKLSLSALDQCKAGAKKDKSLARAYYNVGLGYCLQHDYSKAEENFAQSRQGKGAEAVANTSYFCNEAREGLVRVKAYLDRVAKVPDPSPIAPTAASNAQPPEPPALQGAPANEKGGTPSAEERLKRLDTLYKKGLINKEEYSKKKAEILKEI